MYNKDEYSLEQLLKGGVINSNSSQKFAEEQKKLMKEVF